LIHSHKLWYQWRVSLVLLEQVFVGDVEGQA
jgi:hypothetical protein